MIFLKLILLLLLIQNASDPHEDENSVSMVFKKYLVLVRALVSKSGTSTLGASAALVRPLKNNFVALQEFFFELRPNTFCFSSSRLYVYYIFIWSLQTVHEQYGMDYSVCIFFFLL